MTDRRYDHVTHYNSFYRSSRFYFILTLLSALLAVAPLLPSFLLAVPTALELWFSSNPDGDGAIHATAFFLLHVYVYWEVDPMLYDSMHKNIPYLLVVSPIPAVLWHAVLRSDEGCFESPFSRFPVFLVRS